MKSLRTIPLTDVRAVRLVCKRCGAASLIPMTAKDGPVRCFNCYTELPGPQIVRDIIRNINWVTAAAKNAEIGFDAGLEVEAPP